MSRSVTVKREVRFQQWVQQVMEFNSRPAGMSMAAWCKQQGISPSTFATRLHKVQDRCLDTMQAVPAISPATCEITSPSTATFVEVPAEVVHQQVSTATIQCGNVRIEVSEDISESFLIKLIGAANNAK